jgi:predicted DsbA family dithiol-disulfide isomerase
VDPVRLVVWSDYLCPWCHNAAYRLNLLQEELGGGLQVAWRSFLLRPRPVRRELEAFVRYSGSWRRPAAEEDAPPFRVWQGTSGPPSHSVPPHQAAKAAARIGPQAFAAIHAALLRGYFEQNRDITSCETLRQIWIEAGLEEAAFGDVSDPVLLDQIFAEHREAKERGIGGVPAVAVEGHEGFVTGAQPLAVYRRWIQRLREGVLDEW